MIFIFIFGLILGAVIVWFVLQRSGSGEKMEGLAASRAQQTQAKEERKAKILTLFNEKERVTNNDVEELLGVSDATATNYLQELEDEGKIKQVGKEGRGVFYQKR